MSPLRGYFDAIGIISYEDARATLLMMLKIRQIFSPPLEVMEEVKRCLTDRICKSSVEGDRRKQVTKRSTIFRHGHLLHFTP
ncbi:hypothetical protein [Microbacter margulisiae]|uniref:Uncharacterized protein n=1 Tax=Microbacter margulisiae TaxID=1350067 RepID=A0A7W5DTN1_9PORP|nr:hypothetical protein [Microbacter margulisiae]MBB3188513.1 hypothetical protein [Microbacter margulisiae]